MSICRDVTPARRAAQHRRGIPRRRGGAPAAWVALADRDRTAGPGAGRNRAHLFDRHRDDQVRRETRVRLAKPDGLLVVSGEADTRLPASAAHRRPVGRRGEDRGTTGTTGPSHGRRCRPGSPGQPHQGARIRGGGEAARARLGPRPARRDDRARGEERRPRGHLRIRRHRSGAHPARTASHERPGRRSTARRWAGRSHGRTQAALRRLHHHHEISKAPGAHRPRQAHLRRSHRRLPGRRTAPTRASGSSVCGWSNSPPRPTWFSDCGTPTAAGATPSRPWTPSPSGSARTRATRRALKAPTKP